MKLNAAYGQLPPAFFFTEIGARVAAYRADHPHEKLLRLGVGDVTGPLSPVVIEALRRAVGEQSRAETFHGYLPETGTDFMPSSFRIFWTFANAASSLTSCLMSVRPISSSSSF